MVKVLMVCMGNICRSPTAHGVFEALIEQHGLTHRIEVDSAGTHAYHVGEPPDRRAQATAKRRGFDLSQQRARKVSPDDFEEYDYVLAMDADNYANLMAICPPLREPRVRMFLEFAPDLAEADVPDPYYGGQHGFDHVLDLVEAAAQGLLNDIRKQHDI